ncbi:MAG: FtsX-like permease family protein [Bacteroidota bacterium]|nr:FtsX-like permease family protein [Bacteroidota bacterium]
MNFEFFIARHILQRGKNNVSAPYVRIAIISVALGIAVMIIAIAILSGFQQEIRDKFIGFGSHIQIVGFDFNKSYESSPVNIKQAFYPYNHDKPGITHIQVFANKAGIIKTEDQIQGIILKGVGSDYDWSYFKDIIIEGTHFSVYESGKTNDILLSRKLSNKLRIKLGDDVRVYFITEGQKQPRGRKFTVAGIYETGLEEFDNLYLIGDIGHIRKLNDWKDDQVAGFEVLIEDFSRIDEINESIHNDLPYDLRSVSIKDLYPHIFSWLELQDMNVVVIIVLMVLVAGITMISTLLVLILERTNMIGILKALGARNWSIRKIFLYNAAYIIFIGLFWGNLIGIGFCLLQDYSGLIPLSQESYYVSVVPINLSWINILILNLGTLIVCTLILIIPSYVITRVTPLKAIRFD